MGDNPLKKMPWFSRTQLAILVIVSICAICLWAFMSGKIDVNNVKAAIVNTFDRNNSDEVGRYQFFVKDDTSSACIYVLDTKTSQLFIRGIIEGGNVCIDLGTVDKPCRCRIFSPGEDICLALPK